MSDRYYSLAVYSMVHRQWISIARSARRSRLEGLAVQLRAFVHCYAQVVEVVADDVVLIEERMAQLPLPDDFVGYGHVPEDLSS